MAGLHRGFSSFGDSVYRNPPRWQMAIEFKQSMPDLPLFVDQSHICGRRDTLAAVAQQALDLNYDGMMLEVHPNPDEAWSDAKQQITPVRFAELLDGLTVPVASSNDPDFLESLSGLRQQIDEIDEEVLNLLADRMKLAQQIGDYKRRNNIAILQPSRWKDLLEEAQKRGSSRNLSPEFVTALLQAVHQESINKQEEVIRKTITSTNPG